MGRIALLPDEVAHKIAAGEVIERPASVVKELVENAIDAQASRIEIEITSGGIEYIRVQDNGEGIAPDDVKMAFQPHATSKISKTEDLFSLSSLGFRGEALPSIASVSKLTLTTRTAAEKSGVRAVVEGESIHTEPCGAPQGTTIEVRQLFYNVPARYKFLKSPATEGRRVLELVTDMAAAHPHIAFTLVRDGKTVLSTQGSGSLRDTLLLIHGKKLISELLSIESTYPWAKVTGYAGTPKLARGSRTGQLIIMNGRVIQNSTIRAAAERAYQGLLPSRVYPFFVLVLDVDPKFVDCNVHPAKSEVRFADDQTVFRDVLDAVRTAVLSKNIAPKFEVRQQFEARQRESQPVQFYKPQPKQAEITWEPRTWDTLDEVLRQYRPSAAKPKPPLAVAETPPRDDRETRAADTGAASTDAHAAETGIIADDNDVRSALKNGRIVGQLHQTYILLEVQGGGLWILDQHIVHERILYEQLVKEFTSRQVHIQQILPEVLELSAAEYARIQEHLEEIRAVGIELEPFGVNAFIVRGVPTFLSQTGGWKGDILEIAEAAEKGGHFLQAAAVTLACKGAVKAGDYLDTRAIKALLLDLAKTENPFTCPHGRPIIVRLEHQEILRRFGRA